MAPAVFLSMLDGMTQVFVTGGTGYVGRPLIEKLLARGHDVRALARAGSERKLPRGVTACIGNALDGSTFRQYVASGDTLVHLVGTPHPGPGKAAEFQRIDLVSIRESVRVAREAGVAHFVYMSVAQPAPIMKDYVAVRAEGERLLRESGIPTTAVRPWYVLGPGHRWPYLLVPLYTLWNAIPATRETAQRLSLVTLEQMVESLVAAIERPAAGFRVVTAPEIKRSRSS